MNVEAIFEEVRVIVGDLAEKIESPARDRLDIYMKQPEELKTVAMRLRAKKLSTLSCITGLDLGLDCPDLEVLYHFCTGPAVITVRCRICKAEASIPSLIQIIPSAEPFERELAEMFGVRIAGLRTTEYLYLPDEWKAGMPPLRKDFDQAKLALAN